MISHVAENSKENARYKDDRECIHPIHCITLTECYFGCVAWRYGLCIRVHSRNAKSIHLGYKGMEHDIHRQQD